MGRGTVPIRGAPGVAEAWYGWGGCPADGGVNGRAMVPWWGVTGRPEGEAVYAGHAYAELEEGCMAVRF